MTKKESVKVTIDSNEASQKPKLVEVLAMHEDTEDYEIKPLSEADFHIGNCIFERKTPSDFASSLEKGRLRDQVERMAGREEVPFIMVEGDMSDFDALKHTDIGSKSLRGMDASIEMKNNITVKYCSNIELLCDESVRLARKEKEDVTISQARQTEAVQEASFIEKVFLAIDGVGVKTSQKLSSEFESLSAAMNADKKDFESVDDVGPSTSEKIYSHLHNSSNRTSNGTEEESRVYNI